MTYHCPAQPSIPTVYITSYSTLKLIDNPRAQAHFRCLLPPIPALLTLHCLYWDAPSSRVCSKYTGVSEPVQRVIYGSRNAMREIEHAFRLTINHLNAGNRVASVQTTCHAGTHRSVAAAEILAGMLRGRGVHVRVVHAHRRRRWGDRW